MPLTGPELDATDTEELDALFEAGIVADTFEASPGLRKRIEQAEERAREWAATRSK